MMQTLGLLLLLGICVVGTASAKQVADASGIGGYNDAKCVGYQDPVTNHDMNLCSNSIGQQWRVDLDLQEQKRVKEQSAKVNRWVTIDGSSYKLSD
jgi:hypothetical protein